MLKENIEMADQSVTVGDIKVLGKINGGEIQDITENVELLRKSLNTQAEKQERYWKSFSDDNVISSVEKKEIQREWLSIEKVRTAIAEQAETKGVTNTREYTSYTAAYDSLRQYLFTTLKLFDDMSSPTSVESADVFNSYFEDYYYALQNVQSRINIGDPGKIRTLHSLSDSGTDGEVALYNNNFYMYQIGDLGTGEWINIQIASKVGEYVGVIEDSPPRVQNQFFLVGSEGVLMDTVIITVSEGINDTLFGEDGPIYINAAEYEPGFIYYFDADTESFVKVSDKNNWRYIVAMNDMLRLGYDVSPQLYEWLTGSVFEDMRAEGKFERLIPKYLGAVNSVPEDPAPGDWMTWGTTSTSVFTKGHVYRWEKETERWIEVSHTAEDGRSRDMLMSALTDILAAAPLDTGYFASVFAQAFFASKATFDSLRTYQAVIADEGFIKSDGFVSGVAGWIIRGDGTAEFSSIVINAGYATKAENKAAMAAAGNAQSTANSAQTAARNAQSTANSAQTAASNAQSTANSAQTAASNAQSTANSAQTAASNAQDTADGAQSAASAAATAASNAQTAASNAQDTADEAQSAASAAATAASNAQTAASNAQSTANSAQTAASNAQDTADGAQSAASAAATAANNAQSTANSAQTAAVSAQNKANGLQNGSEAFSQLAGIIAHDAALCPQGWALRTADFDPSTSQTGFGITKDGNLYANNGVFRGTIKADNGIFSGEIFSGPLISSNQSPIGQIYTIPAGSNISSIYNIVDKSLLIITDSYKFETKKIIGSYLGISFSYLSYMRDRRVIKGLLGSTVIESDILYLYDEKENLVYSDGSMAALLSEDRYINLKKKMTIQGISENLKTLKLINIPTYEPVERGIVWSDNGVLKIKT